MICRLLLKSCGVIMSDKDYVYSSDQELFNAEQVEELSLDDGDNYYRAEREHIKPSDLVVSFMASEVIERMQESLFDEVGEIAEDHLDISDEAEADLLQMIKDWADKNATVNCWKAINIEQLVFKGSDKCAS